MNVRIGRVAIKIRERKGQDCADVAHEERRLLHAVATLLPGTAASNRSSCELQRQLEATEAAPTPAEAPPLHSPFRPVNGSTLPTYMSPENMTPSPYPQRDASIDALLLIGSRFNDPISSKYMETSFGGFFWEHIMFVIYNKKGCTVHTTNGRRK